MNQISTGGVASYLRGQGHEASEKKINQVLQRWPDFAPRLIASCHAGAEEDLLRAFAALKQEAA